MKVDLDFDIEVAEAGVRDLEKYLLSREIYWPLSLSGKSLRGTPPKFTLGVLLLTLQKLSHFPMPEAKEEQVQRLADQTWMFRQRWLVTWRKKAAQEYRARLTLWTNFINDYKEDHDEHASRYGYEVQRRVMLELLAAETREIPEAFLESVNGMDALLRAVLVPGAFLWDPGLEASFPKEKYWYLYGKLKTANK